MPSVTQKNFAKIGGPLEIPNLLALQRESFAEFTQHQVDPANRLPAGLEGVFREMFPIKDDHKNFRLEFLHYEFSEPRYSPEEALARGVTYARPLRVFFRLVKTEFGKESERVRDVVEQEVFFCDLPWMTANGSFISTV